MNPIRATMTQLRLWDSFILRWDNMGKRPKRLRKASASSPNDVFLYGNLASIDLARGRDDAAQAAIRDAQLRKLDNIDLHEVSYLMAFLEGDAAGMAREISWAQDKKAIEDLMTSLESDTEAYYGHDIRARELSLRAVEAAERGADARTEMAPKPV